MRSDDMQYKILINVYVPEIERNFEMYIPVNEYVEEVIKGLNIAINDIVYGVYPIKDNLQLVNRRTGEIYDYGFYVRNTSIKNGTQLVLF